MTLLISVYSASLQARAPLLKKFESDYCTMFMDGPADRPGLWKHCCLAHDLRYWVGGSSADMDRTDLRLKSCVQQIAGENWADLIYFGVRAGHHAPIKHKYHWSWGWMQKRDLTPLTDAEKKLAVESIRRLNITEINIEEFLKIEFNPL